MRRVLHDQRSQKNKNFNIREELPVLAALTMCCASCSEDNKAWIPFWPLLDSIRTITAAASRLKYIYNETKIIV